MGRWRAEGAEADGSWWATPAAAPSLRDLRGGLFSGVELFGFVQAPGGTLDGNDDGVVDYPVDGGGGDGRVAEMITEFFLCALNLVHHPQTSLSEVPVH